MDDKPERIVLTEEQKRRRRARSIAIAVALGALVILFYIVTLVKGPGVLHRWESPIRAQCHHERSEHQRQQAAAPPRPRGGRQLRRVRGGDGGSGLRGSS